ncbi:uncharacterized protein C1orf232 isoform X1 [Brienomyrus brachyistius]|uniref:uncharacterized protein C1orf232 isoform X1 n=1 Tax=Brienomyrus brachyistius TaxID=42636 RepID=UPI0020B1B420|nr:uncharacterized protein C1orf232 isoform X1 [Brienomyrus brachyistius]
MNPLWKTYKSKVMKTINPEVSEDAVDEQSSEPDSNLTPVQEDENPNTVSQLAKKMQGAGSRGWKSMSALFNKEDEHQLLEAETQPAADHPLAIKPEEPPPSKQNTGFWDNFATKWQQAATMRQGAAGGKADEGAGGPEGDGGHGQEVSQARQENEGGDSGNAFSKHASPGGNSEDTPFKWNFVTSKLVELKSKSMNKTN